ncbi:MAG: branched-chain amino acid ABC transporter permease [Alphaproteobacteria bacterium]|nr:branched-chain amino acid ABC transporter permease [Alphaproteobacteria bacterium]
MLTQLLLNTLIIGSGYAIVAMVFRLLYSVSPFFNMALGASVALGAYLGYGLLPMFDVAAYPIILAGVILFTWAQERFIYRPMRKIGASPMVLLVVSLGVYTIFESVIHLIFGPQYQTLGAAMDFSSVSLGSIHLPTVQAIIILLGLITLGLISWVLYRTFLGKEIRAIAGAPDLAFVTGINIGRVVVIVSIIAGAVLGAYGVCVGFDTGMEPTMGFNILFKGMIGAIVGGPTILAAYLGSMVLALAENLGVWFFASQWRDLIAFVIFIVLLWIRPNGIFTRSPKKIICEFKPKGKKK